MYLYNYLIILFSIIILVIIIIIFHHIIIIITFNKLYNYFIELKKVKFESKLIEDKLRKQVEEAKIFIDKGNCQSVICTLDMNITLINSSLEDYLSTLQYVLSNLSINLSFYHLSICQFIYLFIVLSIHLSIYLSIFLSFHPSTHPSTH